MGEILTATFATIRFMRKNRLPVIASLLKKLQTAGFDLYQLTGETFVERAYLSSTDRSIRQEFKTLINSAGICFLEVLNSDSICKTITINLNRKPDRIATTKSLDEDLIDVIVDFKKTWAGRSWPVK